MDDLKSSAVAKTVRGLKKHDSAKVKRLADGLVTRWLSIVQNAQTSTKKAEAASKAAAPAPVSTAATTAKTPVLKSPQKPIVNPFASARPVQAAVPRRAPIGMPVCRFDGKFDSVLMLCAMNRTKSDYNYGRRQIRIHNPH